jgi:hypothetical protein
MVTAKFSFEGGTNGANVAAGAGASTGDTNFDAITRGTNATLAYDNTHPGRGSLGVKIATGASSVTSFVSWTTTIGTQTTTYIRALCYFTANPAANHRVYLAQGATVARAAINLNTNGKFLFQNAAFGTVLTSNTIPLNSQFRLEAKLVADASVGQWEYKIWYDPRSVGVPDDTQTSAATQALGGTSDTYRYGISAAAVSAGPYWLDDVAISTDGYIGPENPRVTGTSTVSAKKASINAVYKLQFSGGPTLKKIKVAGSVTETTSISGGPTLKKIKVAGSVTEKTSISGNVRLRKIRVAGSLNQTSTISGGPHLKKVHVSGTVEKIADFSGGPRLKKIRVAGSLTETTSISGSIHLRKVRVSGSVTETTSISGNVHLRKIRVTGVVSETSVLLGDIHLKKIHIHVDAVRPVAAPLMVFAPV